MKEKIHVDVVLVGEIYNNIAVLAQLRDRKTNIYPEALSVPGGAKEEGDKNNKQAGIRELSEETGVCLEEKDLIFVDEDKVVLPDGQSIKRVVYCAKYDSKRHQIHQRGEGYIIWISPGEYPDSSYIPGSDDFFVKAVDKIYN